MSCLKSVTSLLDLMVFSFNLNQMDENLKQLLNERTELLWAELNREAVNDLSVGKLCAW